MVSDPLEAILENPPEETIGSHSGEMEASQVMRFRHDLVKMDRAGKELAHASKSVPGKMTG